jgi:hypothetical protein
MRSENRRPNTMMGDASSMPADDCAELAGILARGFLRIARPVAVSDVTNPAGRLDVSALQRPHVTDNEAA